MNGPSELLRVDGLVKVFGASGVGGPPAGVNGVSLSVRPGETLAIVGESESGKSTLAGCILLLARPDAGAVYFDGRDVTHAKGDALREFRRKVRPIFQDPYSALDPRLVGI